MSDGNNFQDVINITIHTPQKAAGRTFYWHVPKVDSSTRAVALELDANPFVTASRLVDLPEKELFQVQIDYRLPPAGASLRLRFSVLMAGMTRPVDLRPPQKWFFRAFRFPFSFVPARSVMTYQLRIHVPRGITFTSDTGFGDLERFDLHNETILLGSASEPAMGSVSGFVEIRSRRKTYEVLVTGMLSLIVGAGVAIAQLDGNVPLAIGLIVGLSMLGGTILWTTVGRD